MTGKIKVCNGDYGETKWRGINEVNFADGFIIYSVAKMNEFYLNYDGDDAKQYTMCHGEYMSLFVCTKSISCFLVLVLKFAFLFIY